MSGKEFGKRLNENREQILVKTSPYVSPREVFKDKSEFKTRTSFYIDEIQTLRNKSLLNEIPRYSNV